jgi:hypothetical protein
MTPEAQTIAIAEIVFPKLEFEGQFAGEPKDPQRAAWFWEGSGNIGNILPDYLNDLNAMHEAEKVLTPDQRVAYQMALRYVTREGCASDYKLISATAAQRAKAFLRALGLWHETR